MDHNASTCSVVPFQTKAVISPHYELGVHRNCAQSEVTVSVTGENSATCSDLRDTVFIQKPSSGCDDVRPQYGVCDVINGRYSDGKSVCLLRC